MTETTSQIPSGKTPVNLRIENLLEKTGTQLGMLCETLNRVQQIASEPRGVAEGYEHPEELRKKAADTSIRILHQIDNLIEDMPRWGSQPSVLEKHYTRLIGAATEAQEAQTFKAQLDTMPHARFKVHLHQTEGGVWGAYLVQSGGAVLLGSGGSAQEALNDFDVKFIEGSVKVPEKPKKKARQVKKKAAPKPHGPTSDQSPRAA